MMGTSEPAAADTSTVDVLIVDDQPPFREVARTLVSLLSGWRVVAEVETGEDAVASVEQAPPGIVLMDINLPGISGIEATRRITAAWPGVRVVLLSTYAADELRRRGLHPQGGPHPASAARGALRRLILRTTVLLRRGSTPRRLRR
jgi:two-component system, NarL family, invasion response regulator UvrY